MAAGPRLPLRLLLLLLPPLVWPVSPHTAGPAGRGRRFSELKVCADAECSMLMYRGEALEDFRGPDCRFVNFTKGDSVYVYYKLAGISPEVWAGSVGQTFGYFPRDLIHVAYEYTKEELQVPADETDFVCFSGGRDDFSNYSVEELLAYLELPSPATGDSEETSANAPPEASEDHGLQSPVDSSSEGREGSSPGALGNSQASEDSGEPAPSPPPPDAPTELSQRAPPSSKPLDMMRDERQAPTGDNSRSSNSSQGPGGQGERTDAYKLLRQEMTLDLKTKFGSTADALVSDDETTRLVTSLEDELSEDLEAEYYTAGQEDEEEEEEDGIEDMPLLTFRGGDDGDDGPSPGRTAVEEGTAGQEPNSSEGAREQVPWALGAANSGHRLRDGADGGAAQPGTSAGRWAEHKSTEDAGALSAAGSHGVDPPPPSAPELPAPAGMAGALGIRGVLQASKAKVSEVDTDKHVHGKGGDVGTERGPMLGETEAEEEQLQEHRVFPPGSGQHSGPAASKDGDPGGAVVHISKEESVGEPAQEGGPGRNRPPSLSSTTGSGKNQQQDSVSGAEKDGVPGSPGPLHTLSREPPKEASEEPPAPNSQSALSESHLLAGLGDGAPAQGRNGSGPPEPAAAVEMEQVGEGKGRLSKAEAEEDFLEEEAVHGAPEVDPAGQTVGAEAPGSQPGEAEEEAEADDYTPEEQLEDENAVSARQARASSTETQDRPLGADLQGPGGADTGALGNVLETKGHREETGRKSEMGNPGEDPASRVPGGAMTPEGAGAVAGHGAQRASTGQDTPGSETHQQGPEAAAAPQMVGSEPTEGEHPEEIPGGSGELTDMAGLEAAKTSGPEPSDDDSSLAHWPPQHLPIISSFFKDLQSWQRFQKYVEARELEALLQDLAVKLAAAQRESLPYNAEKVLDKVFRTAEAHILSEAERMLDARGSDSQDPSARDREAFEEAAVLDDVQDLIYFVRYQHPTAEPPTLPAMPPPPGDTWEGPVEDPQPPVAEDLSQEKMEDVQAPEPDLIPEEPSTEDPAGVSTTQASPEPSPEDPAGASTTQVSPHPSPEDPAGASTTQVSPEPSPKDPAGASTTQASPEPSPEDPAGVSTTQVSPEPSPEEDTDTGMLVPGSSPVDTVGTDTQPEADVEEAARATPLDSAALLIYSGVASVTQALVAALPEDVQPGPDFYGLPWQPLLATALLGVVSFVLFWRMILEVKSKKYQVTEQQISEKVKNLKKENSELAQQLSDYEQKLKESKKLAQETKKLNAVLSDKAVKYEDKIKKLEESNEALNGTTRNLQDLLESERVQNAKNQDLILENKKSIQKLKDVILMNASELSEVQIALNEAKLGEEKVKFECQRIQEENIKLKKKKEQLQQEVKVWTKSHSELSEQLKSFAQLQKDMEVTVSLQQEDIGALTNCITQLNCLDCESELESQNRGGIDSDELANGEVAGDQQEKLKSRIRQMMDVSRTQTAVAVVEEDLKLLQSKLRAAMSTRCTLEDQIKKLEDDRSSLLSVKSDLEDECKALKQKVEILNELYQEKEMMLQKKLSQEEYERQEREQRLSAADEKADLAAEEVKTYKRRIEEMEEELVKTERSFKSQIAAHEKKAHDNWLKARAAERAMAEEKRESTNLRHKLLEMTQKMAMMREEPVIVKPLPGRPSAHNPPCRGPLSQNGSFGPSPVSGGECSPPLPADSPARPLSATTLNRREASRSEFDAAASGAAPMMNNASGNSSPSRALDEGKPSAPQESGSPSCPSTAPLTEPAVAVPVAVKGPPSFPGMPLLGGPMGGPPPPPVRYGVPPQLIRPFGPRPMPPMPQPFGPGLRPLVGLREYAPGVPPGKRDGPYDPREFVPGHAPFRPLGPSGPREYFIPGTRLPPPPPHGPQDYPPQPHGPQDYQSPPHGPQDYPRPPHGPQDYPRPPHGPQDYPRPPHGPQDYPPPVAARDLAPSGFQDEAPHASQAGGLSASQAPRQSP